MFTVYISGAFRGHFKTKIEAFEYVGEWAEPYNNEWRIEDPYGKVVARS